MHLTTGARRFDHVSRKVNNRRKPNHDIPEVAADRRGHTGSRIPRDATLVRVNR